MGLCQKNFKALLAGLTNQHDISDFFAVTPLETKIFHSAPFSMTKSLFFIQPLLPTMPRVTIPAYMACLNNVYDQLQNGDRVHCVFIKRDIELEGMRGLHVAQVLLFPSFTSNHIPYPCALVQWFVIVGDGPCGETGMWIVKPEMQDDGARVTSIIHVKSILRGAHLIGVYGEQFLPRDFSHSDSLIAFQAYYVNKFIDYHANEIAF